MSGDRIIPGRAVFLLARIALGGVLVYAAYTKLVQPWQLFAMSIQAYQLLPEWGVTLLARTLPGTELLLGVLLVIGWPMRIVATAASALLAGFFAIMLRSYLNGQAGIDCGCFGVGEALSAKTLLRDGALLGVSLGVTLAAFWQTRRTSEAVESVNAPTPGAAGEAAK